MHRDKIKDMIRSILPSKGARSARSDKSHANRKNRHAVRQTLREWGENDENEVVNRIHHSDRHRRRDIREMVMERRGADKIRHFVRWCERKTAHISEDSPQERYFYISGLIGGPSDVIREHALGHFLRPDWDFNVIARNSRSRWRYGPASLILFSRDAFQKALQWSFECCPSHLNLALLGRRHSTPNLRWGEETSLKWHACKFRKDSCVSRRIHHRKSYSYQTLRGNLVSSSFPPGKDSYRPGTLEVRTMSEEKEEHDQYHCENRIIIRCQEDVDRLINFVFGDDDFYRQRPYGYERPAVKRLNKFFIAKNLLEDRLAQQQD